MKNVTWQQVVLLIACLVAVLVAYKYLGTQAAGVSVVASTVLNFMLGRDGPGGGELDDKTDPGSPPQL